MSSSSQSLKKAMPLSLAEADAKASLLGNQRHEEHVTKDETVLGRLTASQSQTCERTAEPPGLPANVTIPESNGQLLYASEVLRLCIVRHYCGNR